MDTPRTKSKKSKKRSSRQASPAPQEVSSRSPSPKPIQPKAGPSRLPQPAPISATAISENFSTGADFIRFEPEDDERSKRSTREWDQGKTDRDREWNRDRDGRMAGQKRKWEESKRNGTSTAGGTDLKKSNFKTNRKAPWTALVDWDSCRNAAEMLHKEVEAYTSYISPSPVEHEVRWMIVNLIATSIRKSYPDAEVLPFGSFGTKLYLPQGDIDLVVQSQQLAYNEKVSALRSLANIVKRTGVTDKVTVIAKARVPIIKFITLYGHFAVDISMNQSNGVQTGNMINRFLAEFPALRALVLIVKSFLNQRNLNEVYSGGLGSYAIVCLAVSHLQMHPKIRRGEIDSAKNLGVLMLEFFELYGKYFNYSNTGISLRHGGSYFNKQARGWKDMYKPYMMCIEDPGDISNDISKGSFGIRSVKQTFAGAFELMASALTVTAGILSARQDGTAVNLRLNSELKHDDAELSVLSSILGVTQETINHRRLVQEVYDQGTLARMLGVDPKIGLGLGLGGGQAESVERKKSRKREAESVAAAWDEADMILESDEERQEQSVETKRRRMHQRDNEDLRESESESRYGINSRRDVGSKEDRKQARSQAQSQSQSGPSQKRRRTATTQDVRTAPPATLFVADEEDEEDDLVLNLNNDPLDFYVDPNPESFSGPVPGLANSSDGLEEIERAYMTAADQLTDEDEDSTYLKGRKRLGNSLSSDQRRAYWAAKAMQGVDSDSS